MQGWTEKSQTQAEVEALVLDHFYLQLPSQPFGEEEKEALARDAYRPLWERTARDGVARPEG